MKITYCQDAPKRFICDQEEPDLPVVGAFVELQKGRYLTRRVEHVGREAIAYVVLVAGATVKSAGSAPSDEPQPA